MKFIHCADIHLDSPLLGLAQYEGAPVKEVQGATRRALEELVALALAESVDFLVIAGDLYDGDWPDFNTGLFFVKQMARLNEAGIKVFMVRGNHDAESRLTRQLPLPPNVQVMPADRPATFVDEGLGVAVHGQSFARASVTDDLAAAYPRRAADYFNGGLLHTSLTGREGHASYAPCRVDTLIAKGYDYWALGHVHRREIVHRDPWIVFPGNTQGRHVRETGSKGCELVTVTEKTVRPTHVPLDVLRWEVLELDAEGAEDLDAVQERLYLRLRGLLESAEGRALALRVTVSGRCSAHAELLARSEEIKQGFRALALDATNGAAWLEKVQIQRGGQVLPAARHQRLALRYPRAHPGQFSPRLRQPSYSSHLDARRWGKACLHAAQEPPKGASGLGRLSGRGSRGTPTGRCPAAILGRLRRTPVPRYVRSEP